MLLFGGSHPASPSIFVSSTVREFSDLRSAIAYTLRAQGFIVYLSEDPGFDVRGDRSAFEECFENIRNCDYYILLIGGMRGSRFKDGISITRQEYRVARERFLSSGRPRLFLYLRDTVEKALQGGHEVQKAAAIDDPQHLASFIDEVRHPEVESIPNYLTPFSDFEELIRSLTNRLNLGRTLSETLTRHSLMSELASNLTFMVEGTGHGAFPSHWYMSRVREEISITRQELEQDIVLTDDHVISLVFALTARTQGDDLGTKAIEESLDRGVFLTFNPANGTLEESAIHKALRQTFEDVQFLRRFGAADPKWDSMILKDIHGSWPGRPHSLRVKGYYVAFALSYYDRVENVFNGHLALCKVLLGLSEELQPYRRQPETPLGELEERKLRAERLSAAQITFFIQSNVRPFGTRIPGEVFGKTREEQVKKITDNMCSTLTKAGIDVRPYSDILESIAEEFLERDTVFRGDGIEHLQPE